MICRPILGEEQARVRSAINYSCFVFIDTSLNEENKSMAHTRTSAISLRFYCLLNKVSK